MVFESQRDFNRFMDGYMDKLSKTRAVPKGSVFKSRPTPDKAIALEDRELQEVVEPKKEKEKKKSLLQKLKLFAGNSAAHDGNESKAPAEGMSEKEFDKIFELDDEDMPKRPARPAQTASPIRPAPSATPFYPRPEQPPRRPVGPISNGVPVSSLRQPGSEYRQPMAEEQEVSGNPIMEKDVRYLIGLVNTLLNRLEAGKKQEFCRSSEFRVFESVRKRY